MAMTERKSIVGVFNDRSHADQAVQELRQAGFRDDQIGVASRYDNEGTWGQAGETNDANDSGAGTGALTGALAGAGLGALAGLGILAGFIPAIGPAIAGGTLGILLSNAAAGAGVAGLAGALIGAGIPEDEAGYYEDEFKAGHTLVTVQGNGRMDEARAILRRHGAYDINDRSSGMQGMTSSSSASDATYAGSESSYAGTESTGRAATAMGGSGAQVRTGESEAIQLREERLRADVQSHEAGEVRVGKEVVTEHRTIEVPVEREEVVIERHAPSGGVHQSASISDLQPGEQIRIPVREDEVHVEKEAVVKEEVSVGKRVVRDTERVAGDVRREELRVERKGDVDIACDKDSGKA